MPSAIVDLELAAAIERGGGFVAKHMGDGVLAYFGSTRWRSRPAPALPAITNMRRCFQRLGLRIAEVAC
jgi:class 3 adenylate cyclase